MRHNCISRTFVLVNTSDSITVPPIFQTVSFLAGMLLLFWLPSNTSPGCLSPEIFSNYKSNHVPPCLKSSVTFHFHWIKLKHFNMMYNVKCHLLQLTFLFSALTTFLFSSKHLNSSLVILKLWKSQCISHTSSFCMPGILPPNFLI